MTQPANYADLFEGHLRSFLKATTADVERGRPFGEIAQAAGADAAVAGARSVGMWVAEDVATGGPPKGAADASRMRERASRVERAAAEASKGIADLAGPASAAPASAEALEELAAVLGGEVDELQQVVARGFQQAAGAPLVTTRPGLGLVDLRPDGNQMAFARERGPPPALALEPVANLRQDVARIKHYALNDALGRAFRPMALAVSSSYFKSIRPPVQLEGDLFEFKSLSGIANAADAWTDAVQEAMMAGFVERLQARGSPSLVGSPAAHRDVLRALEMERAALDLVGALEKEPGAASIPAEALVLLVVPARLSPGGLTP